MGIYQHRCVFYHSFLCCCFCESVFKLRRRALCWDIYSCQKDTTQCVMEYKLFMCENWLSVNMWLVVRINALLDLYRIVPTLTLCNSYFPSITLGFLCFMFLFYENINVANSPLLLFLCFFSIAGSLRIILFLV